MANTRIKDISTAATTLNSDDFIAVDGSTAGTRKMAKADLISEVSSGVSGTYLEESNNLSDVASLDTSKLNMEIPDVGTAPNEVPLNGMLGSMAFQSAEGISAGTVEADNVSVGNVGSGYSAVADKIIVGDEDGSSGMTIASGSSSTGSLFFADGTTSSSQRAAGKIVYNHSADQLQIGTVNTTAITIDSSQLVGIGTDSPSSYNSYADDLVVGDASGNRGITISSGSGSLGSIYFADGTTGNEQYRGYVGYSQATDTMSFGTGSSTQWQINSSGNLVAYGAGVGIDFGSVAGGTGTPAANGGLLDDYERGTSTPTDVSGAGLTLAGVGMNYVKIGSQVTAWVKLTYPTTSDTSTATVGGFPFAFKASDIDRIGGFVVYQNTGLDVSVLGTNSSSEVTFRNNSGTSYTNAQLSAKIIWFCVTYDVS